MSETQTEPQAETDIPLEEPAPSPEPGTDELEGDDETEGDTDLQPGDEPEPAAGEPEAAEPALSEKEVEKINQRLETLRNNTAKRLGEILGEDANFLVPCPLCNDPAPSMVWPAGSVPLAPEKLAAVSQYIGLPDLTQLQDAPDAQRCPDCDGRGEVRTNSLAPGYTTKVCSRCVGKGYIGTGSFVQPEVGTNGPAAVAVPNAVTPQESELPPEAQALKDRGWMVIPPMVQ